ncbi:hypothetical protein GDO78_017963 [Eleutherodactylus coqui]|uniref:RBR-type E3 ubiquitin transferase n=1 Tax=Eleutherodactylus coqui TaxID=57060 RepID=A0A8J6BD20_ELECQ|nr:hypothetical protein GDO78_017963 [Eleutherodactylus coqui]KAG9465652.1 hypothetical protein GDO78_017963 [Eleutherodactylus coqui]
MSREDQEDELLALTSIYAEDEFKRTDAAAGGEFQLCLELPSDFVISIKSNSATNSSADNFENTVSFLPPIVLNFELPPGYPSTTPPNFTLSCKWLTPTQVKDLVGEQLFSRFDRLLLQSSLDLMADIVYCPRLTCQMPVMQEPGGTMGICSVCQYAFCILCKMTFHGISPCKEPEEKPVELNEGDESDDEDWKRVMEKAFDKKKNIEWIKENAKPCPSCKVPIQKDEGCNKMTCSRCKQYFCWVCLKILPTANPYRHFEDPLECLKELKPPEEEEY